LQAQAMARIWLAALSPGEREIFLELIAKITLRAKPEPSFPSRDQRERTHTGVAKERLNR
jgi:hypothetical protein